MTAGDPGQSSPEQPVVDFRPVRLPNEDLPPEVQRAADFHPVAMNESRDQPGELFTPIVNTSVKAADAVSLGWIVRTPVAFTIEQSEGDDDPVITAGREMPTAPFFSDGPDRSDVITVDTHWQVRIPDETVLLAYPLFNHVPGPVTAVPTVVADEETEGFTAIRPRAHLREAAWVPPGMPFAQLVLTEPPAPSVETRELTEDEEAEVDKNERAMDIYPEWYRDNRAQDRV